jgi:hypothetical protein
MLTESAPGNSAVIEILGASAARVADAVHDVRGSIDRCPAR